MYISFCRCLSFSFSLLSLSLLVFLSSCLSFLTLFLRVFSCLFLSFCLSLSFSNCLSFLIPCTVYIFLSLPLLLFLSLVLISISLSIFFSTLSSLLSLSLSIFHQFFVSLSLQCLINIYYWSANKNLFTFNYFSCLFLFSAESRNVCLLLPPICFDRRDFDKNFSDQKLGQTRENNLYRRSKH